MLQHQPGPFHSLERKLPVLIGGLVAVLVMAALAVTHYELRSSAFAATDERLQRVGQQLAELLANSIASREQSLSDAAADPALTAALRGGPAGPGAPGARDPDGMADSGDAGDAGDPSGALAVLRRIVVASDSALPTELRDRHGRLIARTSAGAVRAEPIDAAAAALIPAASDRIAYSPLHVQDGRGVFWVTVPVRVGGTLLGHIHQQRSIGSRTAGAQLEQLLGTDIDITFTNAAGDVWIGLDGDPAVGAEPITTFGASHVSRRGGRDEFVFATELPGPSWVLVAATPVNLALARAREGTRRLLAVGIVLLLIGGLAAWLVSRSVTAPLHRLGAAADAIAGGDYSRRTGVEQADEIGFLARSFDKMVTHVEVTHGELAARFAEARTLAGELEVTNARLQRAVREIELARSDAQHANRAKSEFLATMSHEIRTPINAMVGYADLMDAGIPGPLTEQQRVYMDRIRRSGSHLISLVNDVLDFAKIESGQMRVMSEVGSAVRSMNDAAAMLHGPASAKGVEVVVAGKRDAQFLGDGQRVQQILLNLLSNALKFTDAGGRIELTCENRRSRAHPPRPDEAAESTWTCITVSDTGSGIEPGQHESIFEPFVQGESGYTRPHGGTGLGLAISRSLARMMHGDLTVDPTPGAGASFTLWLPHPSSAARPEG
jgi:signal transduction histidine kinase